MAAGGKQPIYIVIDELHHEQLRSLRVEPGLKFRCHFQIHHGGVIAGGTKENGLRLRLARTNVTGRPTFWRASTNEMNASPLPEYVSSCNSGSSSKGSSPSFNRRQRESSSTSPSLTRRVFTLLNDLSGLRHSMWSTSSCSSDD